MIATAVTERLDRDGFVIVRQVLKSSALKALHQALEDDVGGNSGAARARRGAVYARRNLLELPAVREVTASPVVRAVIEPILGVKARPVRGILFDKTAGANWVVPWHQDLSITVHHRRDVPGFGPWSMKAGVHHVQPPIEILRQMLTVRLHLDDCPEENGPLRVIPGSHRTLLKPSELDQLVKEERAVICCVEAGDAVLMRPLLAHTSAPARNPSHRRVLHLEFAGCDLPGGLEWRAA